MVGANELQKESGEVTVFLNTENGKKEIGSYRGVESEAIAHINLVESMHWQVAQGGTKWFMFSVNTNV